MSTVHVHVTKCIEDNQEGGSAAFSTTARMFFTIGTETGLLVEDSCDIRRIMRATQSSGQIDVSRPHGYQGPYDHLAFTSGIAAYYAKFVADSKGTRPTNNTFEMTHEFTFEAEDAGQT